MYPVTSLPPTIDVRRFPECAAQELCESRGGRPGLPVPNNPYSLSRWEATFEKFPSVHVCVRGGGVKHTL